MAQADVDENSVSALFDKAFRLFRAIEEGSDSVRVAADSQHDVRKAILIMEDCTRHVSILDVFSRNENIKEVPTEHVKYLLLPALLGVLHGKVVESEAQAGTPAWRQGRRDTIRIQEVYYRDFLQRCRDYEICRVEVPKTKEDDNDDEDDDKSTFVAPGPPDLAKECRDREEKLKRYQEQKAIEQRLKELERVILAPESAARDEDVVREFYVKTIKQHAFRCQDELSTFETEKAILKHMTAAQKSGQSRESKPPSRPLKPIIITRDAVQKEVFGLGYKNLPVMSIEEFYEQRVKDGWFPSADQRQKSLQERAAVDTVQEQDDAARLQDDLEDRDDPDELAKKRNWDEYKDEHRRGEGNRHNMG